jgi:tRNA-specific 2-thiouridylase
METGGKKTVVVGLSGGVDSSVAAALLQDAGYQVIGVFIKAWQPDFLPCTWKEDRQSAMQVAATLAIPFHTVDLSVAYKQQVFDAMIAAYTRGETPNPDVACNEFIKFGFFLSYAVSRC